MKPPRPIKATGKELRNLVKVLADRHTNRGERSSRANVVRNVGKRKAP